MLTKPLYVFSLLMLVSFLLAANSVFADISVLENIAEAERDLAYIGLRLKTFSTPGGARTMEEVVIHKNAENSYRKVESIVGERRSFNSENERERKIKKRMNVEEQENLDGNGREAGSLQMK